MNEQEQSGILSDLLRQHKVYLGGSTLGKGLHKACQYYLQDGSEESFYVVDIGVLVSQVYQWRKCFPRVEPFYAVKCNPDPVIVRALAVLGANFDCASQNEIALVQELSKDLPRRPEIIFANPCKAVSHIRYAVAQGVPMVTFDNVAEVQKCAAISKDIQLILRIITDDRGSQCRLSSKFGAPPNKWRPLLAAAKKHGLQVVGVSFHVGSGCRDAARYQAALKDARTVFDMAKTEFGFEMKLLDIGGGFPGESHSMWNPESLEEDEEEQDPKEGTVSVESSVDGASDSEESADDHFMFFSEIAEQVAPMIDEIFPADTGVRVIAEPGRYFVAAAATLCCSVVSLRSNELDDTFEPEAIQDHQAAKTLSNMTREEEREHVRECSMSMGENLRKLSLGQGDADQVLGSIVEELADYSRLFARQNLAQQEADTYNDPLDLYKEGFQTASDLLGPPDERQQEKQTHTVEGMNYPLVAMDENEQSSAFITLAAAGEAAVNGVVMQAVADSAPLQDDFAYYINDGVYGAFNNLMFDHASVRPRVLRRGKEDQSASTDPAGFRRLLSRDGDSSSDDGSNDQSLFASTVFGPTCDSIDVVARSVLLPKLQVGDWLYFQNMGAYTMAASSSFNGFVPSEKFYVCSVQPEYFEALIAGPDAADEEEEKKEEV